MSRFAKVVVMLSVISASTGVVTPVAHAAPPDCLVAIVEIGRVPDPSGVVSTGGGQITVSPSGAEAFLAASAAHLQNWSGSAIERCAGSLIDTAGAVAACIGASTGVIVSNLTNYVYVDASGNVVINYGGLLNDAGNVIDCVATF